MRALHGLLVASDLEAMAYCQMELYDMDYLVMHVENKFIFGVPRTKKITPSLLMAHIDTLRNPAHEVMLAQHCDTLINLNGEACGCLGADDRAGVHVVLEIARKSTHKPYVLLTLGEERGYTGALAFVDTEHPEVGWMPEEFYKGKKIYEPYLEDLYAVVQFDRKGFNEATFYGSNSQADLLQNKVLSLGYFVYTNGSSDSTVITEKLGIAGVNLSCGFMHQHTPEELLLIPAVQFAIDNGRRLLALIDERIPLPKAKAVKHNSCSIFGPVYPPLTYLPEKKSTTKEHLSKISCDICGKKRTCTYIKHAKALVCNKCINRIGGTDYISEDNLVDHIQDLDRVRGRSRRANRGEVTPCPVCFETEELHPQNNDVVYCHKCRTSHVEWREAVYFWHDGASEKVYVRKYNDPANILEMHEPTQSVPIEWCHACDMIFHRLDTTNYDGFIVCHGCNVVEPRGK